MIYADNIYMWNPWNAKTSLLEVVAISARCELYSTLVPCWKLTIPFPTSYGPHPFPKPVPFSTPCAYTWNTNFTMEAVTPRLKPSLSDTGAFPQLVSNNRSVPKGLSHFMGRFIPKIEFQIKTKSRINFRFSWITRRLAHTDRKSLCFSPPFYNDRKSICRRFPPDTDKRNVSWAFFTLIKNTIGSLLPPRN